MPTAKKPTKKITKPLEKEVCCKEGMKKNLFKHHKKSSC
jgi:hypothetical protein